MNIATGQVTTIAGAAGQPGTVDAIGSAARFISLMGITTDGEYLYVTQTFSNTCIRRIALSNYEVTTIAATIGLDTPIAITCDGTNLFVTSWGDHLWQIVIATGQITELFSISHCNNTRGITYDGKSLYVGVENYNRIDARW